MASDAESDGMDPEDDTADFMMSNKFNQEQHVKEEAKVSQQPVKVAAN